jgi:hypothetical protein
MKTRVLGKVIGILFCAMAILVVSCVGPHWPSARDIGTIPSGWIKAETNGTGTPATWKVISDLKAPGNVPVIAITHSSNRGQTYNLLIADQGKYKDLQIKLWVKARSGVIDQGGGPIWRCRDRDNYYIARWNPLEDNFRLYYVRNSKRKQLASANVQADPKIWHQIEIDHRANRIKASFDGKELIDVVDSTFTKAGRVGLWTKADAATTFDRLKVATKWTD